MLIHELVEWYLCQKRGIPIEEIDRFDLRYEWERSQGLNGDEEPGDDPGAPYRREHRFAENIERQIVHEAGLVWADYEQRIAEVGE